MALRLRYRVRRQRLLRPASEELRRPRGSGIRPAKSEPENMKIRLTIGEKLLPATLINSATMRDFVALLPLKLRMNDLFEREKYGHLPRKISENGKRDHTYEVGDIGYWSPEQDLAIFYRNDGQNTPDPGIIVIGKLDSGVEVFNVPNTVEVALESVTESNEE
jgi:hypothetical protein